LPEILPTPLGVRARIFLYMYSIPTAFIFHDLFTLI
jgi:hypothetical protein